MTAKTKVLLAITALILLLQGGYLVLDWLQLVPGVDVSAAADYRSNTKLLVVVLSAVVAWLAGDDGLGSKDVWRMRIIFVVIVVADVFFNRNMVLWGVPTFCLAQLALIERNGVGLRQAWRAGAAGRREVIAAALILVLVFAVVLRFFANHVGLQPLFWMIAVYTVLLSISTLVALASVWVGHYPRANAMAMAVGMFLFVCCDITVMMRLGYAASGHITQSVTASCVTWIFYTPAVYLLAVSGHRRPLCS